VGLNLLPSFLATLVIIKKPWSGKYPVIIFRPCQDIISPLIPMIYAKWEENGVAKFGSGYAGSGYYSLKVCRRCYLWYNTAGRNQVTFPGQGFSSAIGPGNFPVGVDYGHR